MALHGLTAQKPDADFISSNIKVGINIFGVVWDYSFPQTLTSWYFDESWFQANLWSRGDYNFESVQRIKIWNDYYMFGFQKWDGGSQLQSRGVKAKVWADGLFTFYSFGAEVTNSDECWPNDFSVPEWNYYGMYEDATYYYYVSAGTAQWWPGYSGNSRVFMRILYITKAALDMTQITQTLEYRTDDPYDLATWVPANLPVWVTVFTPEVVHPNLTFACLSADPTYFTYIK